MVPVSKIEKGIAAYLDNELMPKLPSTGIEKVLVGTTISLAIRRSGKIIDSYKDNKVVKMLGIMDDAGDVDVDVLADELKKNIPNEGVSIEFPVIGSLNIRKKDVDDLREYIMSV